MSAGMTPYDFVQQVYYAQEKVILDFWPHDDKYKEVLMEANLVLQELQNVEDWTWLRERIILGDTFSLPNEIPEYKLPDWVYKPSTNYHDSIKLCRLLPNGELSNVNVIEVPWASAGDNSWRKEWQYTDWGTIHVRDFKLRAVNLGGLITFNRPLFPHEAIGRVAVCDVQRRLPLLHICDEHCELEDPEDSRTCKKIEKAVFTDIPDPNYMVMATACRHAQGSPPAQYRIQDLQDAAQKILSAMRQNDAAATSPDYIEWDIPGYYEIV